MIGFTKGTMGHEHPNNVCIEKWCKEPFKLHNFDIITSTNLI